MAKRFFYVCAGLLCLALSYHLGARSATAQASSQLVGVDRFFESSSPTSHLVAAAIDGTVYLESGGVWTAASTLPGQPVSIVADLSIGGVLVGMDNGDVYYSPHQLPLSFSFVGNPLTGATSTRAASFGSLKVRYRGQREPQGVKSSTDR